jgi:hypothetical protein
MASGHTGRPLTTHLGSMGQSSGGGPGSVSIYAPKRKARSSAGDGGKDLAPGWVGVLRLWTFFVLGVFCIVCGAFGVFAQQIEGPLSASVAWLGSAYVPVLRVTAVLCIFVVLLLVRRGWSSHDREPKGSEDERRT